jgi:hypothetical protein
MGIDSKSDHSSKSQFAGRQDREMNDVERSQNNPCRIGPSPPRPRSALWLKKTKEISAKARHTFELQKGIALPGEQVLTGQFQVELPDRHSQKPIDFSNDDRLHKVDGVLCDDRLVVIPPHRLTQ